MTEMADVRWAVACRTFTVPHTVFLITCGLFAWVLVTCAEPSASRPAPTNMTPEAGSARVALVSRGLAAGSMPSPVAKAWQRLQYGFRRTTAGYVGQQRAYRARVNQRGALTFSPRGSAGGDSTEPECTFETVAVELGGRPLAKGARTELRADGAVAVERGPVVEQWQNTARGVAQSWTFAERPTGSGPLQIRVAVSGMNHVGRLARGLQFQAPSTDRQLSYGAATWIDAAGHRSRAAMAMSDGHIAITVDEHTLVGSRYPAVLDPIIYSEQGVGDNVAGPAYGQQTNPAIASDGESYLIVWEDSRTEIPRIFGARVSHDGLVLDPVGFPISGSTSAKAPTIAFDGNNYLVAWVQEPQIRSTRVSPNGEVVDSPAAVLGIDSTGKGLHRPKLAFGSYHYLLVYGQRYSSDNIALRAQLVTPNNHPYATPLVTDAGLSSIATAYVGQETFLIVRTEDFFVPIVETDRLLGTFVAESTGQEVLDGAVILEQHHAYENPVVANAPTGALVLWRQNVPPDGGQGGGQPEVIAARRVHADGTMSSPFTVTDKKGEHLNPALARRSDYHVVVWQHREDENKTHLCQAQLDATDQQPEAQCFPNDAEVGTMAVAANHALQYVVAWVRGKDPTVVAAHFSDAGIPAPFQQVPHGANRQSRAAASFNGSETLLVWVDHRDRDDEQSNIYGVRLDADGGLIDGSDFCLSCGQQTTVSHPKVASDGTDWLVVWLQGAQEYSKLHAALVSPDGRQNNLDICPYAPPLVCNTTVPPAVAFDGKKYLIVWIDEPAGFTLKGIRVSLLEGVSEIQLDSSSSIPPNASVAATSTNDGALVAWTEIGDDVDINAVWVNADGKMSDPLIINTAKGNQYDPAIAFDGERALIVWTDGRTEGGQIYGAIVTPDAGLDGGTEPHEIAIATLTESSQPTVAYTGDGYSFLVAWQGSLAGSPAEIFGAGVSPSGQVHDSLARPLTDAGSAVHSPALANQPNSNVLLAYHRYSDEHGSDRVRVRQIYSGEADGTKCTTGDDCASRMCTDGFCCREECDGKCESCSDQPGTCTVVRDHDDDTCLDDKTCDIDGNCKTATGRDCPANDDCASGFCVGGKCCDTACNGPCESCPKGQCARPECKPYKCVDAGICHLACDDSSHCTEGFQCTADRTCVQARLPSPLRVGCGCRLVGYGATSQPQNHALWWLFAILYVGGFRRTTSFQC